MGDVVEGFAHGDDQRLVLVEHAVQQLGEVIQFVVGAANGDAGVELAGVNDRAGGGNDFAHRFGGAVGEKSAAGEAEDDDGSHHNEEDASERLEDGFAVVRAAADLEDGAVGLADFAEGVVPLRVFGHAEVTAGRVDAPRAKLEVPGFGNNPVRRGADDIGAEAWNDHLDEKWFLCFGFLADLGEVPQRGRPPVLVNGGGLPFSWVSMISSSFGWRGRRSRRK